MSIAGPFIVRLTIYVPGTDDPDTDDPAGRYDTFWQSPGAIGLARI
jgi:hypothetical protein